MPGETHVKSDVGVCITDSVTYYPLQKPCFAAVMEDAQRPALQVSGCLMYS